MCYGQVYVQVSPSMSKVLKLVRFRVTEFLSGIRISGSQLDTRGETKLWLARHLEVIRRFTVDDLRVVKVSAAATFNSASV